MANKTLNAQQAHWEKVFFERTDMFGLESSYAARRVSEVFKGKSGIKILELGGGQGRDTIFLAGEGFQVNVLDYSNEGLKAIREKSQRLGVSQSIVTLQHDIRQNLPFEDASFDGCFSHMLYCMALTTAELEFISQEIHRVLKPEGLNIYTVRNTSDVHYETGIHRGEDMRGVGGFIVHFFNREKVEHLAEGYMITGIEEFEEGNLPRRLFLVTLKKDRNVSNTINSPRGKKPGRQQEET
jgi:ubiquinone/menaquinone biosynthesis C-methylase UbiE